MCVHICGIFVKIKVLLMAYSIYMYMYVHVHVCVCQFCIVFLCSYIAHVDVIWFFDSVMLFSV